MSVDPVWQPGGLHEALRAWLDAVLPAGVAVVDAAYQGNEPAPHVLLARVGPTQQRHGMTGPNVGALRVRAISVHDTLPQAWALAELVRVALVGEGQGRVYTHTLTLPGVGILDRRTLEDATGEVVAGVPQVGESYEIEYQRA